MRIRPAPAAAPHRVVIVGGGAGGLELATRLGDGPGRRGALHVTLVDRHRTHVWKPLLHEIAAGSLNPEREALDYLAQAHWHHFHFRLGRMTGLDRARRVVITAPTLDEEGRELIPQREIGYDSLVLAVGSHTHDFGTPGAAEHAVRLDTAEEAARFHTRLVNACIRANAQPGALRPAPLHVAIIGGGATGVELAAELHKTTRQLVAYGFERLDPERAVKLTVIEAGPRILPALPTRLSDAAHRLLTGLRIDVLTGERVTAVEADGVRLGDARRLPAELTVWAAGIRAPAFLAELEGLESNRLHQLVVRPTLQTTHDDAVFALGDCASCPWPGHDGPVPARAQAAHQQAAHLARNLVRRLRGATLRPYVYRDFGSLVSLGKYSTVGSLMGSLVGGTLFVEGVFARLMYIALYRHHLYALHGAVKVAFDILSGWFTRRTEPRVKLH